MIADLATRARQAVLRQLQQGVRPRELALAAALGFSVGVFPILGTTTLLCLGCGVWLKLNQPILQLSNWAAAPLQLPGIYFFVRLGEWLTRVPPVRFSIAAELAGFKASPLQFLQRFGMSGLRGVLAWLLVAPLLVALLYVVLLPPLRRLATLRARPSVT